MKERVVVGIAALLLLCCSGCAGHEISGEQSSIPHPEDQVNEPAEEESIEGYDWRLSVPAYNSAEEAANMDYVDLYPIFILHEGRFYNLESTRIQCSVSNRISRPSIIDALARTPDELPVLNLAEGDQLVTFSADSNNYGFVPVSDLGACLPVVWRAGVVREQFAEIYGSNPEFEIIPTGVGQDMSYVPDDLVAEIDGQTFTPYTGTESGQAFSDYAEKVKQADAEFCGILDSLNIPYLAADWSWNNGGGIVHDFTDYIIQGDYNDTITLGQYQGTKYVETDYMLVNTLYSLDVNGETTSEAERTHDGYFVIQIPDGISGTYAIRDRTKNENCYAFSIVR